MNFAQCDKKIQPIFNYIPKYSHVHYRLDSDFLGNVEWLLMFSEGCHNPCD